MPTIDAAQRDLAPALTAHGFQRVKRTKTWRRDESQLAHLFRFELRSGNIQVQWGVLSDAVIPDLWLAPPADAVSKVDYAAMTGWLNRLPGTDPGDAADSSTDAPLADRVADAASWLAQFRKRENLVSFLMDVEDSKDPRGFLVPANLPLKLLTCAFLLAADDSPEAPTLAQRALAHLGQPKDALTQHRLDGVQRVAQHNRG